MAKPSSNPLAVSLLEKDARLLSQTWHEPSFAPHVSAANVLDYFAHPTNFFYDSRCNNELIKMQGLNYDHLKNMTGIEYVLAHVQEPILYIIKKQERRSPQEVEPLATYYVLAGIVYQAPDVWSVVNSRLVNTAHYLHSAASDLNNFIRYHPSNGYHWEIKHPKNEAKVSFVPLDNTRKAPEETGTTFQRKHVDSLLAALTQKYPHKPMPSQHPFGPKVPKENVANEKEKAPSTDVVMEPGDGRNQTEAPVSIKTPR